MRTFMLVVCYALAAVACLGGLRRCARLTWRLLTACVPGRRRPASLSFAGLSSHSRRGVAMAMLVDPGECRELLRAELHRVEKNFAGKGGRPADWPSRLRDLAEGEGGGEFVKAVERAHSRVYSLAELEALADLRVRFPELGEKETQLSAAIAQAAEEAFRDLDAKIEKSRPTARSRVVAPAPPRSRTATRSTP